MKIAMPSDDQQTICAHFGRAKGFLVYELDNNEVVSKEYRTNTFTGHAKGLHVEGANGGQQKGHKHNHGNHQGYEHKHQHDHGGILAGLADCETIIARGMGRRLLVNFEEKNKKAIISTISLADEAVNNYIAGTLKHNPDAACEH